jgi:hypothetical protein
LVVVTTPASIVHVAPAEETVMSPLSPSEMPPPPGGAAQVPSARRKFVVPPPEAGASPLSEDVNVSSIAVVCAVVSASGVAGDPVLLPIILFAARFAMRASVMWPASTEADRVTAFEPLKPTAAAVIPPPEMEKLREVVRVAALPVVFWLSVGTSAAAIVRNVGVPAVPLGAARNVLAVCEAKLAGVTANVPPSVILPDVVTVPESVRPDTVPVPLTLVTVPEPPLPPPVQVSIPLRYVM